MNRKIQLVGHSVRGIANWILDYAEELGVRHTNMGINKLTFFGLEAFLIKKNILITNAKIEAWEHGPVFRELYQSFKSYGNGYIGGRSQYFRTDIEKFVEARASFSDEDETFLRASLLPLMHLNAAELRALSHRRGGAWDRVWWYDGHANPGMEIAPTLLIEIHEEKLS